jgi:hypothetical protein
VHCRAVGIGDTIVPQSWVNPADAEIRFEDEVLYFGEADEGDEVLAEYLFTNTGVRNLEIEIISACECMSIDWTTEEIPPNKQGKIEVIFNTKGWPGDSEKTIDLIFKNTDHAGYPLVKQVKLKGRVLPK